MAQFEPAFKDTMREEGGYVNNPRDHGKETYRGVSRRYHPDWKGWRIVDEEKSSSHFPKSLDSHRELQKQVKAFYKLHYWNAFLGDDMPSQSIAQEMFDTAVNMGTNRAIRFLQSGLNLLNRDGKLYPDLVEDGVFGRKTLSALSTLLRASQKDEGILLVMLNVFQGAHYAKNMRKSSDQETFCRGWFKRVTITKEVNHELSRYTA